MFLFPGRGLYIRPDPHPGVLFLQPVPTVPRLQCRGVQRGPGSHHVGRLGGHGAGTTGQGNDNIIFNISLFVLVVQFEFIARQYLCMQSNQYFFFI